MRFGISVNDHYGSALDDARWAESVGLDRVAMPDHVLRAQAAAVPDAPAPEPFVQLAAIAASTRTIGLATLVSPVTFRHPAMLLKAATELSVVSGGRFTLGLGTGYRAAEHEGFGIPFPPTATRYALLEDALGYLAAGRSAPNPGYSGRTTHLAPLELSPAPDRLRLMVGGAGATRTPDLAGRFADEFNTFLADPDALAARIARARSSYAEAGRPGALTVSVAAPLLVGSTEAELRAEADRQAPRRGLTGQALLTQQRDAGTALVGTPAQVADHLLALGRLGVEEIDFVFDGPVDRVGVLAVRDEARAAASEPPQDPSTRENHAS